MKEPTWHLTRATAASEIVREAVGSYAAVPTCSERLRAAASLASAEALSFQYLIRSARSSAAAVCGIEPSGKEPRRGGHDMDFASCHVRREKVPAHLMRRIFLSICNHLKQLILYTFYYFLFLIYRKTVSRRRDDV